MLGRGKRVYRQGFVSAFLHPRPSFRLSLNRAWLTGLPAGNGPGWAHPPSTRPNHAGRRPLQVEFYSIPPTRSRSVLCNITVGTVCLSWSPNHTTAHTDRSYRYGYFYPRPVINDLSKYRRKRRVTGPFGFVYSGKPWGEVRFPRSIPLLLALPLFDSPRCCGGFPAFLIQRRLASPTTCHARSSAPGERGS